MVSFEPNRLVNISEYREVPYIQAIIAFAGLLSKCESLQLLLVKPIQRFPGTLASVYFLVKLEAYRIKILCIEG